MNHTALHEDIRKKHDERMQAHAGDVNTTVYDVHDLDGKSFVNSTGNVTAMDVQISKNRRRMLVSYMARINSTYPERANHSRSMLDPVRSNIHAIMNSSSSPFLESDLNHLFKSRAGQLKAKLQSRLTNKTAFGKLQAHFGPGVYIIILSILFLCIHILFQ